MTEAMFRACNDRYKGQPLEDKQRWQLVHFCEKTQPFLPFAEVVFLDLLQKAIDFSCQSRYNPRYADKFKEELQIFSTKYYPHGFKGKGSLDSEQYRTVFNIKKPRFKDRWSFPTIYNPIEKTALVKTQRACYKWLTSQNSPDCTDELIDALIKIGLMLPR